MSEETSSNEVPAVVDDDPMIPVVNVGSDLLLNADNVAHMESCQKMLVDWVKAKLDTLRHDHKELQEAHDHAVAHKWKHSVLKRHAHAALKRCEFYEKVLKALEAGYMLVPNFPVSAFVVRTDRKKPTPQHRTGNYWAVHGVLQEPVPALPAGEGDYKNPFPVRHITKHKEPGSEKEFHTSEAGAWGEMDFPISMAKVPLMRAADRAMALKIFDELSILPAQHRKEDPMIVGVIHAHSADRRNNSRRLTFIIAWHLDTRML